MTLDVLNCNQIMRTSSLQACKTYGYAVQFE